MSEKEGVSTESDTDESSDEVATNKALPWHCTDLAKTKALGDDASLSSSSNEERIRSSDKALHKSVSHRSASFGLKENNSIQKSFSFDVENQKKTATKNAIPWEDTSSGKVEIKDPPTEINLLLLGESGVGKSTFINSFANYMKHENFEAVQGNMLSVLIPARFNIFDKEFKKHVIEIGANDENEYLADGAAATQDVKTYVFYITIENKSYMIRLIDTPGMGDPRGIDQDNKNCDYVLSYLGRLEKIHAICLLLKPTNTRLDVFLNYCVTQILSRLEKSATDNIAFLFTNTRGQNYTPGDTYTSLELLVKKIKDSNNVLLPLSHKNVFCFDNEAFRFLASIKQGVEFRDGILEANVESWKYSYQEVYRLLSYIVQLKPHDPQKTISINHARKIVLQLSQPLAEIVQLIGDNIYQLDQHTNQLLMENQTLDELKQKLYMPVIDIRAKELPQPVTVCTAHMCSTIYKVADKNKFHYKQRCHNPCYLNNVSAEIVGDPHLLKCWAMNKSTQTCHQCGCRFNTHMHIYYETDTFETKIVDKNVQKNINSKEDATREKEVIINKILNHKEQLEKEHKYIIKCSAAFAHFLQQNAITPINDSLKEYVKYLITREENLGPESDRANLDYLRRLLCEYEQEKNTLEEALKHNPSGIADSLPQSIESKIRDLFTLPNFGKKIKELYDLHQSGGKTEHKQSEYVVKERYTLSIVDKFKSYKNAIMGAFGMGQQKNQHRLELERQRALSHGEFKPEYFDRQLQRQKNHSNMQNNVQYNEQFGNLQHFGPNGPRQQHNNFNCYEWEVEDYLLQRRQYELNYYEGGEGRQALINSRRQFLDDGFDDERNRNHQTVLNVVHKAADQSYKYNENSFSGRRQKFNGAGKSEKKGTSGPFFGNAASGAQICNNTKALGYSQNGCKNKIETSSTTGAVSAKNEALSAQDETGNQIVKINKTNIHQTLTQKGKKNKKKNKKNNKNK